MGEQLTKEKLQTGDQQYNLRLLVLKYFKPLILQESDYGQRQAPGLPSQGWSKERNDLFLIHSEYEGSRKEMNVTVEDHELRIKRFSQTLPLFILQKTPSQLSYLCKLFKSEKLTSHPQGITGNILLFHPPRGMPLC